MSGKKNEPSDFENDDLNINNSPEQLAAVVGKEITEEKKGKGKGSKNSGNKGEVLKVSEKSFCNLLIFFVYVKLRVYYTF
jgi:hypothetical protein